MIKKYYSERKTSTDIRRFQGNENKMMPRRITDHASKGGGRALEDLKKKEGTEKEGKGEKGTLRGRV